MLTETMRRRKRTCPIHRDLRRTFEMSIPVEDIPECEMLVAEISVREWRDNVRAKIFGSNKMKIIVLERSRKTFQRG